MTVFGPGFAVLGAEELRQSLPMLELIPAISNEFSQSPTTPKRTVIELPGERWQIMSSYSPEAGLVCKVVNVALSRRSNGYPLISGALMLLSPQGDVRAIVDAGTSNARRSGAVAAWATSMLAKRDASVLALFGVGSLAEPQIEAINCVRPLREIRIVAGSEEHARSFAARMREGGWNIRAESVAGALHGADIVSTCTTSPTPVFPDDLIEPGTHINAIGQYRPDRREIPAATVARAKTVVESLAPAWEEAGELVLARVEGLIGDSHVVGELMHAESLTSIRTSDRDITLFKSIGSAVADLAAARVVLAHLDERTRDS